MAPRSKSATLSITIAGDAKGAKKAMGDTETGARGLGRTLGGLKGALGGVFASGALIAGAKKVIDTTRQVGGELLTLQRLTGSAPDAVAGLYVAAQQSGVAIDKLSTGIGILASKIQSGALEKFGIQAKDAAGNARSFEDILGDVQARYQELEGLDRTAFARGIFGRGGADLMKILGKTREEMQGFTEDAKRLGLNINSDDIKQATEAQRDFQLALTGAQVTIGKELLPVVTQFMTSVAKDMPAIADVVGTVARAFTALPGPLKAVVGLSIALNGPLRLVSGLFGPILTGLRGIATSKALDGFRLGLMGVTQAGSGAGNAIGGFIASSAAAPAVMAGAAIGVAALVTVLIQSQEAAAAAKANIADLVSTAQSAGGDIEGAFREKLALTLAGADGGFKKSWGDEINAGLQELGISASEFFAILQRGGPELEELGTALFNTGVSENGDVIKGVRNLRTAWIEANRQQAVLTDNQRDLGVETAEAADATDEQTAATYRNVSATRVATDAVRDRKSKLDAIISAAEAVKDAEEKNRDAVIEVAEATRAAAGDSDEMRDAKEAEADAHEGVADALEQVREAEAGVGDANERVREATESLTEARADAAETLRDLTEASRDARQAEEEADLTAREKADEARRGGTQNLSDLEKERLNFDAEKAREDAAQATIDRQQAEADEAAARAAGIEGDQGVIDAKEAVADAQDGVTEALKRVTEANEGVTEANKRVSEAEQATADVAEAASARLVEAKAAAETAARDFLNAQAAAVEATDGLEASIRFLQERLLLLYPEGSPQRRDIEALVADLGYVLSGGIGPGGSYATPDAADRSVSPARRPGDIPQDETRDPVGRNGGPTVNLYVNGTAAQERRMLEQQAQDILNGAAIRFR